MVKRLTEFLRELADFSWLLTIDDAISFDNPTKKMATFFLCEHLESRVNIRSRFCEFVAGGCDANGMIFVKANEVGGVSEIAMVNEIFDA